jgi:flavin reductase (DIM6/NTAB) family NADH-FMN oxidoreductase RutF
MDFDQSGAGRGPLGWWRRRARVGAPGAVRAGGTGMEAEEFRALLRHLAASVVVVTVAGPVPVGFTATSFASVSLHPPLVSFNISRTSSSWPAIRGARHIGVHILGDGQETLARTFATQGVDRFAAPTSWHPGPYGVPVLDGTAVWLVGRIVDRIPAGDHVIVLAEALLGEPVTGVRRPLIYHMGRHLTVPHPAESAPDAPSSPPEDAV